MYATLANVFNDAAKDEYTRVVLWHGAGNSFSAGNDIEDFLNNPPGPGASPQARLMNALVDFDKPLIAAVQGAAIGGGTTMLTHCDFVYAGESARFQMPFINLAVVPEFGSSWSRRLAGGNAGRDRPRRHGPARSESVCVGITIDSKLWKLYWTQKGPDNAGLGGIFRADIDIPKGESPSNRSDIEVLFDQLPEPIDLEFDLTNRVLYWTDRGDPPRGNTVNRAPVDKKAVPEILITLLMEGIGIALDVSGSRMFVTDFAGSVYSADLDGKNVRNFLYAQGNLTGIAYAEV
jgi:hypothetical protein